MHKIWEFALPLCFLCWVLSSCSIGVDGNGTVVTETREVAPFDKIRVDGAFEVEIEQGKSSLLLIESDENIIPLIDSEVVDGVLAVENREAIGNASVLKLKIQSPKFSQINLAGASNLKSVSKISSDKLSLSGAGACKVDLEFSGNELSVDMNGACKVKLAGKARNLSLDMAGAGDLNAAQLVSRFVSIDIAGAGKAAVHAKRALDIAISGTGEVTYKGSPKITKNISGSASITPIQ